MPTTGIVNATLIGIYVEGVKVAMATSGTLSINQALRTSINKDDLGWEKSLPAGRSWSLSGDSEFAFDSAYTHDDFAALITSRAPVAIKFSTEITGDIRFTGSAYIESLELSGGAEENATYSYSLKGTGVLTKEAVPVS